MKIQFLLGLAIFPAKREEEKGYLVFGIGGSYYVKCS
jgi:hypothetical protein